MIKNNTFHDMSMPLASIEQTKSFDVVTAQHSLHLNTNNIKAARMADINSHRLTSQAITNNTSDLEHPTTSHYWQANRKLSRRLN